MKGWLLRQPAGSQLQEDITPVRAWQRESVLPENVPYPERLMIIDHLRLSAGDKLTVSKSGPSCMTSFCEGSPEIGDSILYQTLSRSFPRTHDPGW